jgi:uncharacterized membrane protein
MCTGRHVSGTNLIRTPLAMQKSYDNWILLAIIAVHLAIALPAAYYLNIWVDESSSLYATEHGFWMAFQNAASEQKQAPLYFWILSLWREIDGSILFARLFSIICSVTAIPLFHLLARRIADRPGAAFLTAFFGLHPFLIWASLEIRVYSLVILLSIILFRTFIAAFWELDKSRTPGRPSAPDMWFLITVIVALYTNYYLGFLIAGLLAALIFSRRWSEAKRFALLMAIAAIAFIPLIFEIVAEFRSKTSGYYEERSVVEGVRILWHHFLTFTFPTEIFPGNDQSMVSFVRLWVVRLVVPLMAFVVFWKRRQITARTAAFLAITLTVGLFLLAAYFLIGSTYVHIRHASVMFVPLLMFLASLGADISKGSSPRLNKALPVAFAIVIVPIFAYSISVVYPNMTKRGDWARVAEFIQQNESPGQPIVVYEAFDALALPYYYRGPNRVLPDSNFFDFVLQGPFGTPESMVRQNNFVISEIPPGSHEIWLVVNEYCIATEACRPLENYIAANYTIELEKEFYLEKVYLLKAK